MEQRDSSREYRKFLRHFRKHFRIPYEILELVQLAKHRKGLSLAARDERGMEAVSTCSAEGQSKLLLILQKMRCVWFKHRQNTVLYCTTVDCTILINTVYHTGLLCRQSSTGRVFGLNLEDECLKKNLNAPSVVLL